MLFINIAINSILHNIKILFKIALYVIPNLMMFERVIVV